MLEARIECMCSQVVLEDLDLTLHKGEVVYIPAVEAKSSMDLKVMQRAKGVQISYVERVKEMRQPRVLKAKTNPPRVASPLEPEEVAKAVSVDTQSVDELVKEVALLRSQLGKVPDIVPLLRDMEGRLVAQLLVALSSGSGQGSTLSQLPEQAKPLVDTSVPVFIPSKIDDAGMKGTVTTTSKVSGDASVDDAAEALKAAKRKVK